MDENFLKHIPTLILSELPQTERDKYFNFLVENDIKFVEDADGYFVAVIKVVNPDQQKAEKVSLADKGTYSSRQKSKTPTRAPKSVSNI